MNKCPKCGSKDIDLVDEEMGFIKCNKCDFDELEDSFPQERNTQREKANYTPYKSGGNQRGKK